LLQFGQTYHELKPYTHPTYGDIEIGGWTKYSSRVPPPFMLEELCHRNAAFTLYHADQMPLLEFGDAIVKSIDPGVWSVTLSVHNTRLIPTISARAAEKKIGARDFIQLVAAAGTDVKVLASGTLDDPYDRQLSLTERNPERIWLDDGLNGHSRRYFRWIVRGSGKVVVSYSSAKAAGISQNLPLEDRGSDGT